MLSNILSTFVMYSGNKRGIDVDGSGYETLVKQNLSTFFRKWNWIHVSIRGSISGVSNWGFHRKKCTWCMTVSLYFHSNFCKWIEFHTRIRKTIFAISSKEMYTIYDSIKECETNLSTYIRKWNGIHVSTRKLPIRRNIQ